MSWFSRVFVPEKKWLGMDWAMGDKGEQARRAATKANESAESITPEVITAPAIDQTEAEALSTKRLARLGRYFTSPIGVLSGASTGSQKVFS